MVRHQDTKNTLTAGGLHKFHGLLAGLLASLVLIPSGKSLFGWGLTWRGAQIQREVEEAPWRLGPFRIRPALVLSDAGWDSNIFGSYSNPVEDYSFTVGPRFHILLPLRNRIVFSIEESPRYTYFLETKRQRGWNNYFSGTVHFILTRFVLSLEYGLVNARERYNSELDIRPRIKTYRVQGFLLWQPTRKFSVSLGLGRRKMDHEDILIDGVSFKRKMDREQDSINLTGYYQLSDRTRLSMDLETTLYTFEQNHILNGSRSYALSGGADFEPVGRIRGRIQLGYKFLDLADPALKNFSGLTGETDVSVLLLKSLTLRAGYRRNFQLSIFRNHPYFIENFYSAGVSFYPWKDIRLNLDTGLGLNHYPAQSYPETEVESELYEISQQERRDRRRVYTLGLYFRLQANVGLGLTAGMWERRSTFYQGDSNKKFISLDITYTF